MIPEALHSDLEILKARGHIFELAEEGGRIFIVFKDYPLPDGKFNQTTADLLIYTTPLYPTAGFDMFWTDQRLLLKNGSPPRSAEGFEAHLGRQWRRFSYHPYNNRPWNPAEDNILTFMAHVDQRLWMGD